MIAELMRATFRHRCLALVLGIIASPSLTYAALGDDVRSIDADRAHLRGALRITTAERYSVHEIAAPSGMTVRQYVAPSGRVFAVTWSGPWPPDLRQLLGPYFERFSRAAASPHAARGPLVVDDADLVVRFGGRLRAFVGTAYLPDVTPSGVRAEQLP